LDKLGFKPRLPTVAKSHIAEWFLGNFLQGMDGTKAIEALTEPLKNDES
jgi:hypothetical protein